MYAGVDTRIDKLLLLQEAATDGLVDLMGRFPPTTYFFINAWTWGYEDILTAIAAHFGNKVDSPFGATLFLLIKLADSRGPVQKRRVFSPCTRRTIKDYHTGHVFDQIPRMREVRSV